MKYQELYQYFTTCISVDCSEVQLKQWWSWIVDFGNLTEEEDSEDFLRGVAERLSRAEPIQYIFNKAFFYDLELFVNEHVLIPRPETEELVEKVIRSVEEPKRIIDIGAGSGAIALMLKKSFPSADITAIDISARALEVVAVNAKRLGFDIECCEGDLFELDHFEQFRDVDVLVSNPPYVSTSEMGEMTQNTLFEPELALFAPKDEVVKVYEQLGLLGQSILRSGGQIFLELNEFWAESIAQVLLNQNYEVQVYEDLQGKQRILHGIKG